MKKVSLVYLLLTAIYPNVYAVHVGYNPSQYTQFLETKECRNCNLVNIPNNKLRGEFSSVNLRGSDISYDDFSLTTGWYQSQMQNIQAHNTSFASKGDMSKNFDYSDFSNSNLSNCDFSVKGTKSTMNYVKFNNVDLTSVNFTGAIIRNADFRGANTARVNFHNADLTGSIISKEQIELAADSSCAITPDGIRNPSKDGKPCKP